MNPDVRKTGPNPVQRSRKSLRLDAKPVNFTAELMNSVNGEVVSLGVINEDDPTTALAEDSSTQRIIRKNRGDKESKYMMSNQVPNRHTEFTN